MKRLSLVLGVVSLMTAFVAAPALADDGYAFKTKAAGQFLLRARAVGVLPEDGSSIKTAGGANTGLSTQVDNNFIPELDLSYFITDNIAVEAIAGVTQHHVSANPGKVNLGDVWLLPPTITAQYHFFTKERISPYIGAGINYTFLFGESGGTAQPMSYSNSFGPAVQAGIDIALTGNWSLNLDVKKIFISTDVKAAGGALKTTVDLDPWLVGVGIGYRF
jgi:outer membrane protein